MVEFALVLPILLLLVMGIIQFGIVFNNYVTLTDGVRAGARQAAVSRTLPDPVTRCEEPRQVVGCGSRRGEARHHRHAAEPGRRNGYLGAGRRRDRRGEVPVQDQALRGRRHGRQAQEQDDRARRVASDHVLLGSRRREREPRQPTSGATSTNGSSRARGRARPRRRPAPAGTRAPRTPSRRGSARRRRPRRRARCGRASPRSSPSSRRRSRGRAGAGGAAPRPHDAFEPRRVGRRVEARGLLAVGHAEQEPGPFAVEVEARREVDRERDPVRELGRAVKPTSRSTGSTGSSTPTEPRELGRPDAGRAHDDVRLDPPALRARPRWICDRRELDAGDGAAASERCRRGAGSPAA